MANPHGARFEKAYANTSEFVDMEAVNATEGDTYTAKQS